MKMIKSIGYSFLERLFRRMDVFLYPEEIRVFIFSGLERFRQKDNISRQIQSDLWQVRSLFFSLGWLEEGVFPFIEKTKEDNQKITLTDARSFFKSRAAIEKGLVRRGSAMRLEVLEEQASSQDDVLIQENLEKLLRHVEIRRKDSLLAFAEHLPEEDIWLERHDTCILFCRHARRAGDLRYLNTAMKMNDWYYPCYKRAAAGANLSRFMLALAEQEVCAKELLI